MAKILVVEDSPQDIEILREVLETLGHEVRAAHSIAAARAARDGVDLIVADIRLPDGRGTDLLGGGEDIPPVILVTAYAEVEEGVEAMRRGAFHYMTKPVRTTELSVLVDRAVRTLETRKELARLRATAGRSVSEEDLVARSPAMREVVETIRAAAPTDSTILLLGESGTGKEVIARLIHRLSHRSEGPFIAVNCSAIPATLLEAELFGHEKGAFTGAAARRTGKFERAERGTLFLDEIGTIPEEVQVRLLRAIQEREIERLGGAGPIKVNIRLVAATNSDLKAAVSAGRFREDLFYRLNVLLVRLPPLRERREEIAPLVARYLARHDAGDREIDPAAMDLLVRHDWPGNVRELENAMERALVLSRGGTIRPDHLPEDVRSEMPDRRVIAPGFAARGVARTNFPTLDTVKRGHLQAALALTSGRRAEAASLLGIHRNTMRHLLQRYGLDIATAA